MENEFGDRSRNDIENPSTNLLTSLRMELESLSGLSRTSLKCSIFRVPERLRLVNEKAYTPQVVSIGPFHHGNERLKPMEEHKKRYLCDFLKYTKVGLEDYINIIKGKEEELRSCYAEPIGFSSDEFVKIILVDAAFIIEFLLRYFYDFKGEDDSIVNTPWILKELWTDMQLLENQLPFFILEELFHPERIVHLPHGERPSIFSLSYTFFKRIDNNLRQISSSGVEHFVDLLRKFYIPLEQKSGERKLKTYNIPSITELHRAGVKFKVMSSRNLFDIRFSGGTLEISKLRINDETELRIRNLLAFEQYHCTEYYMTDYVVIMNCLVNTPEDVDWLVKNGIFENQLWDSSQAATLINNLGHGVLWNFYDFNFAQISRELCDYCKNPWNQWKANLKQKYFNTPWASLSVIAAVLLIILTIIQTICSIVSVTDQNDLPPH